MILSLIFLMMGASLQAQKGKNIEKNIFVTSFDSVRIYGTLLIPQKVKEPVPLAIFISGSGPTDRNGNQGMMGNNSLKYYAEGLNKKGIASFRYDKRGTGQSLSAKVKEVDLRFEHYVEDVSVLVDYFSKDQRFSRIIIIGHSEGSLIGMIAAQNPKVSQYVSVSGVGRTADLLLQEQLEMQNSKQDTKRILDSLKMGYEVKNLGKLKKLFRPSVQPYMMSWFKYDPCREISKLNSPVLILQGDNDIQVKEKEANFLKKAKPEADLVVIPQMNHVLKIIKGDFNDNLKAYYNPDIEVSKVLIKTTVDFIKSLN